MKSIKRDTSIKKVVQEILSDYPQVQSIIHVIDREGGRALLIGGVVRDALLGLRSKDLDIEVHGISLENLEKILAAFGPVSLVGKAYGVLRLHSLNIDWSIPREDASGRKPHVALDPSMSIKQASERRDLTMNAIAFDMVAEEVIDPFNGIQDLQDGILRACNPQRFTEDPLRFYRVMQFISRFEMYPDDVLTQVCTTMNIQNVSVERIEQECNKMFLKSARQSLGLRWLASIKRLQEVFPELYTLIGVPQDPHWHPEGDVFEHTMQAIDAAAYEKQKDEETQLTLVYAAMCHDLGKSVTTQLIDGKWRSRNHAKEGVPIAQSLLSRMMRNHDRVHRISLLVHYHMAPGEFIQSKASAAAYKRLANKVYPHVSLRLLADLAQADKSGRNPESNKPFTIPLAFVQEFIEKAKKYGVLDTKEEPVLVGKDLLAYVEPGPILGELLRKAYSIQIEQNIHDKHELIKRVLS